MKKLTYLSQAENARHCMNLALEAVGCFSNVRTSVCASVSRGTVEKSLKNEFDRFQHIEDNLLNQCREYSRITEKANLELDCIPKEDNFYRLVLTLKYIGGRTWDSVASSVCSEEKITGNALKKKVQYYLKTHDIVITDESAA